MPHNQGGKAGQTRETRSRSISNIVASHVSHVTSHFETMETLKRSSPTSNHLKPLAPITWPCFIASCEATPDQHVFWREWWQHMLQYRIGNIKSLWQVVEEVWKVADARHENVSSDNSSTSRTTEVPHVIWRGLMRDRRQKIIAI